MKKVAPPHDIFVVDYNTKLVQEIPKGCASAGCVATVGSGFSCPGFVSVNKSLDLFVSDGCNQNTAVYKMAAGCYQLSCASSEPGDYFNPFGTASDSHGNLYVADYSHGLVKEVPSGCHSASCVVQLGGDAFVGPYYPYNYGPSDVTLDKHGNVYVASYYYLSVMPPNCTSDSCVTRLGGGWNTPWSVSLDKQNNVYIDDRGNKEVKKMPPGCSSSACVTVILGGFNDPLAAKADGQGNVYVSDSNSVKMIPKGCGAWSCVVTIGGGFSQPVGLAVGP